MLINLFILTEIPSSNIELSEINLHNDMANKNIHVTQNPNGGWNVRGAGDSKPSSIENTQAEAIFRATQIAKNNKSEVFIHGRNGKFRERNTFGNDPYPPKG